MKQINSGYESLFEFLARKDIPFFRLIDSILYKDEYNREYRDSKPSFVERFTGSLQSFVSMINDVSLTFKPYGSVSDFRDDLLQPLRGLGNVLRGVISFLFAPVYLVLSPFMMVFLLIKNRHDIRGAGDTLTAFSLFRQAISSAAVRSLTWMIDGVASVVRGLTQIVTTPLTWFCRIPLRAGLTAIKGPSKIEDDEDNPWLHVEAASPETAKHLHSEFQMDCHQEPKISPLGAKAVEPYPSRARPRGFPSQLQHPNQRRFYFFEESYQASQEKSRNVPDSNANGPGKH